VLPLSLTCTLCTVCSDVFDPVVDEVEGEVEVEVGSVLVCIVVEKECDWTLRLIVVSG
jgi:hypothetical protein